MAPSTKELGAVMRSLGQNPPANQYIYVGSGSCQDGQGKKTSYYYKSPGSGFTDASCQAQCNSDPGCVAYAVEADIGDCVVYAPGASAPAGWNFKPGTGAVDVTTVSRRIGLVCMKKWAAPIGNVVVNGLTYTKSGGGNSYNAYASWVANSICVTAGQTTRHVRIGLTTDAADDHNYPNGKYIGLFPNGRLYKPPGSDSSYTTSDIICMRVEGSNIVASKNGANLETWVGSVGSGTNYVKLFFHEVGNGITVSGGA